MEKQLLKFKIVQDDYCPLDVIGDCVGTLYMPDPLNMEHCKPLSDILELAYLLDDGLFEQAQECDVAIDRHTEDSEFLRFLDDNVAPDKVKWKFLWICDTRCILAVTQKDLDTFGFETLEGAMLGALCDIVESMKQLDGQAYGYQASWIEVIDGKCMEHEDSCYGFIGEEKDVKSAMVEHLPKEFHELVHKALMPWEN